MDRLVVFLGGLIICMLVSEERTIWVSAWRGRIMSRTHWNNSNGP